MTIISGTVTLSSTSNNYTGTTTLENSTLVQGTANAFSPVSDILLEASSILDVNGFSGTIGALNGVAGSIVQNSGANPATLFAGNTNNNGVFQGSIEGNGLGGTAFTKIGTGTQTMSGNSTNSGLTSVLEGVLAQGIAGAFSNNGNVFVGASGILDIAGFEAGIGGLSGSGTVTNSGGVAPLYVGANNNGGNFAGSIIDGASQILFNKLGGGTQILSGTNTYSGTTTVYAGVLAQGAANAFSGSSDMLVAASSTLDLGGFSGIIGALFGSGLVTNNGNSAATLSIGATNNSGNFSGTISDGTSQIGLNIIGTGTQTLSGTNTYSGTTTVSAGVLVQGAVNAFSGSSDVVVATSATLDIGGFNGIIGTLFGSGLVTNNGAFSGTFSIGATNDNGNFSGTISDDISQVSIDQIGTGTQTFTATNTYSGTTFISAGAIQVGDGGATGSLGSGPIVNNANLIYNLSSESTITQGISGSGNFTQMGTGTTIFQGTNVYTGSTMVLAGVLAAGAVNAFSGSSDVVVATSATLDLAGYNNIIGALFGSGLVTNNGSGPATLTMGATNDSGTFMGSITDGSGTTSINKVGTGTQAICGTLTYTGSTIISEGVLIQCGQDGFSPGSDVFIASGGTFDLGGYNASIGALNGVSGATVTNSGNNAAVLTIGSNNHSGTFGGSIINGIHALLGITKVGTGTETLSGVNTYTGTTTVTAGVLAQGAVNALSGSSNVVIAATGTLDLGGYNASIPSLSGVAGAIVTNSVAASVTLSIGTPNNNGTFAGIIQDGAGPVALNIMGTGTQTLTGNNTYTGNTAITSATLQLGNGGSSGSILGNINNNGGLVFNRFNILNIPGVISGTGSVTQLGSGTTILQALNTYSGTTFITAGVLAQGIANAFSGNSNVFIGQNGTMDLAGFSGTIGTLLGSGTVTNSVAALVILNVNANNSGTFSGTISNGSGTVSLTKTGTGTLTLTGNNTYTGVTTVNNGALFVNGRLASSSVLVNANGVLSGMGTIVGNVINNGAVNLSNTGISTLTVQGNYVQASNSTLVLEYQASNNTYDLLAVGGSAQLSGTLVVVQANSFEEPNDTRSSTTLAASGGPVTVLTAGDGIGGTKFDFVDFPNGAIIYTADSVLLEVGGIPSPIPPSPEPSPPSIATALVLVPTVEVLIPRAAGNIKNIVFNLANTEYGEITTRLAAIRGGASGMSLQGLNQDPMAEQLSKREARLGKTLVYAEEPSRWDVFAAAAGIFSTIRNPYDLPTANTTAGYFSAGADYRINQYANVGIYAGYQGFRTSYSGGESWLRSNGVKYGLYGSAQCAGFSQWQNIPLPQWMPEWSDNLYLNAIIGGGANFISFNRSIPIRRYSWMARSYPFAGELDSLVGAGYEFNLGPWRFGANTSIQYTYLGISSFNESGAGELSTKVGSQTPSSLVYSLGGSIAYLWEPTLNCRIFRTIGLSWQHEFMNYAQSITARFVNGSGPAFTFYSPAGARNNAFGVAGITAQFGTHFGAYAYYNPQFGGGQVTSQSILVGLSYNF